jgi:uncharacterized membrane protein
MRQNARVAGHAVHPMLIVFPLGLLGMSVVFDVIGIVSRSAVWGVVSYWNIAAGVVMGLVAGVFGLIDLRGIPSGTRASRVGLIHGVLNVVVLGFFGLSLLSRTINGAEQPSWPALVASVAGLALAVIAGWLGGELVEQLGVSVDERSHLDAASSLRR